MVTITKDRPNFNLVKIQTMLELLQMQRGAKEFQLRVSLKKTKVLGTCSYRNKEIIISAYLDDTKAMNTLKHEFAHALAGPNTGHGPRWVAKCHLLGIPAVRCAPQSAIAYAPLENQKFHIYTCQCSEHKRKRRIGVNKHCLRCNMDVSKMAHRIVDGNGNPA